MDNNAGEAAAVESLGYLLFQPYKIWKFVEDHILKVTKKEAALLAVSRASQA